MSTKPCFGYRAPPLVQFMLKAKQLFLLTIESSMDNQDKSETNPVTEDSDNKEALAKDDNEPTTTSSAEEKADDITNSEAKPDSPPKSPDQSQGKPEEEENSESIQNYVAIKQ